MKPAERQSFTKIEFWFLAGNLILSLVAAGGYIQPIAAVLGILLGAGVLIVVCRSGKIVFSCDLHVITFTLIPFMYLVTVLWAVDQGMALEGFIHFLPLFLFYILICRIMDEREKLIDLLPVIGSLMTVFSFIMMQFPVFQNYVSVANRLSGFFQYPNTYALFMLICLLVAAFRLQQGKIDWLDIVYCGVATLGIYLSGSRITFVLLLGVLLFFIMKSKKIRKIVLPMAAGLLVVVAVLGMTGITGNLFGRLFDLSFHSSTLLGRLLYALDALKLIIHHPFGCGYYGYYFLQTEIQTGVYSVVSVHNEFLQLILDIGIIPAVLFYGTMIATICKKDAVIRNRLAVLIILLHSLLDYDFQFLSIGFVLVLFLNLNHVKEYRISLLTKAFSVVIFALISFAAVHIGMSDFMMMNGQYERAIQAYDGNTLAKIYRLTKLEDIEELRKLANSIIDDNQHVPLAYHALAQSALADGKVSDYLKYKEQALELAPYDMDAYEDYLDALSYCFDLYQKSGEKESTQICLQKAQDVPKKLETLKEKTSWLGWQIDDTPQVELSLEYQELIEKMERECEGME